MRSIWLLRLSVILLSLFFVFAGVMHFVKPAMYVRIMPPWLMAKQELVYLSGVAEICGGFAFLFPAMRRWAGLGLILLLIAVFPANIHMALNSSEFPSFPPALLWARLPLQFVLIGWIWWIIRRRS